MGERIKGIWFVSHSKTPKLKRTVIAVAALAIIQYWICPEEVIYASPILRFSGSIPPASSILKRACSTAWLVPFP